MSTIRLRLLPVLFAACLVAEQSAPAQTNFYSYRVDTAAGSYKLGDSGPATSALMEPIAVTTGSSGTYYIGEVSGRVRQVVGGTITTLTSFDVPVVALAVDRTGLLYAATARGEIYKVSSSGTKTLYAGAGTGSGDGIAAIRTRLFTASMVFDTNNRLIYADFLSNRVRAIGTDGVVNTIAGSGGDDSTGDNGPALQAQLEEPFAVALDGSNNIYIAEFARIRKVNAAGVITTVAGNGDADSYGNGSLALTAAVSPDSLAIDSAGNIYFGESYFDDVRKLGTDGRISLVAGTQATGSAGDGGSATQAQLNTPTSIALDDTNGLLIVDSNNARVRRVASGGTIQTVAGAPHFSGDGGSALNAVFFYPYNAAYDAAGNLYVADQYNLRVRKITPSGTISTLAGNGEFGTKADNVPATSTPLGYPYAVAVDPSGNVLVSVLGAVRRIDNSGNIATIAGSTSATGNSGNGGSPLNARFRNISAIAFDKAGNMYLADNYYNRIRKVTTATNVVSAFAGSGSANPSGDGGPALSAGIPEPNAMAFDSAGNLYVVSEHSEIRRIAADGTITTIVETGLGDALTTTPTLEEQTTIGFLNGVTVDSTDTVYFSSDSAIVAWKDGKVWLVAGDPDSTGFTGDGGPALNATFGTSLALAAGPNRSLAVVDTENQRVRVLSLLNPTSVAITAGNNQTGSASTTLPTPLTIRVTGAGGVATGGVPVTFAITNGTGNLATPTVYTDANGIASTTLTLGSSSSTTVTATVSGLAAVQFTATASGSGGGGGGGNAGGTTPRIYDGGVVGAGLSAPATRSLSSNGIATIFGENFIDVGTKREVLVTDLVNNRIPTNLGSVCVQVGTIKAPIFGIYPGQINFQAPQLTAGNNPEVKVIKNCGTTSELVSNSVVVPAAIATPEFFVFKAGTGGHSPVAARLNPNNVIVGPPDTYAETSRAAKAGDIVTIYGTGFGLTTPAYAAGELPSAAASISGTFSVSLGGVTLAASDVLYVGVTPGSAGLYQLNIRIPSNAPVGEDELVLKIGNAQTPSGPYLLISN